jgi:hypothetical protein
MPSGNLLAAGAAAFFSGMAARGAGFAAGVAAAGVDAAGFGAIEAVISVRTLRSATMLNPSGAKKLVGRHYGQPDRRNALRRADRRRRRRGRRPRGKPGHRSGDGIEIALELGDALKQPVAIAVERVHGRGEPAGLAVVLLDQMLKLPRLRRDHHMGVVERRMARTDRRARDEDRADKRRQRDAAPGADAPEHGPVGRPFALEQAVPRPMWRCAGRPVASLGHPEVPFRPNEIEIMPRGDRSPNHRQSLTVTAASVVVQSRLRLEPVGLRQARPGLRHLVWRVFFTRTGIQFA